MVLNIGLFKLINNLAGKVEVLDWIMIGFAKYLVFVLVAFLVYLFIRDKKNFVFCFLGLLVSLIISKIIGLIWYFPRPFKLGIGTNLIQHVADSSFPSDHGVSFFSFSFALLLAGYKKSGIVFLMLGALVSFARIYTGLHFPADVLGSLVVSFIGVVLVWLIYRKR